MPVASSINSCVCNKCDAWEASAGQRKFRQSPHNTLCSRSHGGTSTLRCACHSDHALDSGHSFRRGCCGIVISGGGTFAPSLRARTGGITWRRLGKEQPKEAGEREREKRQRDPDTTRENMWTDRQTDISKKKENQNFASKQSER